MKEIKRYYRVNKSEIGFIRYVFEAHDGLAVITTLNGDKDTIIVRIAPGCEDDVDDIISGLKPDVFMEEIQMETENVTS